MATLLCTRGLVLSCVMVLSLNAGIAFASLYTTKPSSTSVLFAGRPAQISWLDDGHQPRLGDLGPMKILLLAGSSTYNSTIAEDVDPRKLSLTVYIPQSIPTNYHVYTLRFVPSCTPHLPIDTAPFTILSNPSSYLLVPSRPPVPTPTSAPAPSLDITHSSDVTTVSRITGTQITSSNASGKYIPLQIGSGSSIVRPGSRWSMTATSRSQTVDQQTSVTWHLDMEKLKFRVIFLVWPAMIGLSFSL